jgi:hypothetical protein
LKVNQFGMPLDRNGYARPLIKAGPGRCLLCGRVDRPLQRHEVFHGPNRQKAKALGCWLTICDECHAVLHAKPTLERQLKQSVQKACMQAYGWSVDDFRAAFGKSWV